MLLDQQRDTSFELGDALGKRVGRAVLGARMIVRAVFLSETAGEIPCSRAKRFGES